MQMIWVSSQASKQTAFFSIFFGLVLLVFSPFIPGLIGIFLAAAILILSLACIGMGITMRGTVFSLPLVILGLVGGFLSLYALLTPEVTVSFMGLLLGIVILLMGISQLFFSPKFIEDKLSWFFLVGGGIVTILVGFYMILYPQEGMQLVMAFLGLYLIIYGIIGFFRSKKVGYSEFSY
ncbi:MAG: hypothetical protein GXY48_01015 [Methanomicrobiales archaeon]|nr:hypothetical protein [Methanomicrobiales archaeon]